MTMSSSTKQKHVGLSVVVLLTKRTTPGGMKQTTCLCTYIPMSLYRVVLREYTPRGGEDTASTSGSNEDTASTSAGRGGEDTAWTSGSNEDTASTSAGRIGHSMDICQERTRGHSSEHRTQDAAGETL